MGLKVKEFRTYHPVVNFIYFAFVIGFGCVFMHPLCLAISLISGFSYSVMLKGKKQVKTNLVYMLPMLILMAIMNPLLNHEGVTIIEYLPDGNPMTLESVIYGLSAAVMIVSVICHFSCFNEIMTSDKLVYLFGKIFPGISLIFSMTLRFVPRFAAQLKKIINAQKCMGRDLKSGNIIKRAKNGLDILSVMTTWSLENAVETADSMKARGYGIPGRTAFSIFSFDKRDIKALVVILVLGAYTLAGSLMGKMYFRYFPSVKMADVSFMGISAFAAYFLLCTVPIIIEFAEVIKWKALKSKM